MVRFGPRAAHQEGALPHTVQPEAVLRPEQRTGIETARYTLRRGENETGLEDLRGLPAAARLLARLRLGDLPFV